jgi:predicted ArsR family transcriptional regulator
MPLNREKRSWTFLTNHALVLSCLTREGDIRIRDIALQVGITERATQLILRDLQEAGYVAVSRVGRRNSYRVREAGSLRYPLNAAVSVEDLLRVLSSQAKRSGTTPRSRKRRGSATARSNTSRSAT